MINYLRSMAVFAKTVECRSFRQAARELNLSPSVVSHHISQLEEQLGVALLYRSTRKLSLTRDGERLLGSAQTMLRAAEEGIDAIRDNSGELAGELHVTAPALLAQSPLTDKMAHFVSEHPKIRVKVDYSEDVRDVVGGGIDVAIRMGNLKDSSLKARKLYEEERLMVASRSFLSRRSTPRSPMDVETWDWLRLTPVPRNQTLIHSSGEKVTIQPEARLWANNATALCQMAACGAGLAILPRFLVQPGLDSGEMQVVLPQWKLASLIVSAVRPQNSPREGLATQFIDALIV